MAIFDWLLKNSFISYHFQIRNSEIVIFSGFLSEFEDDLGINLFTTYQFRKSVTFLFLKIEPLYFRDTRH